MQSLKTIHRHQHPDPRALSADELELALIAGTLNIEDTRPEIDSGAAYGEGPGSTRSTSRDVARDLVAYGVQLRLTIPTTSDLPPAASLPRTVQSRRAK
jgi:hypothetical protein